MKRWELLALALLALLLLWGAAPAADVDDALITYRYAENLAAGRGFSYNPGEWIWGTSTPLFTLMLAALAKLGVPPPLASRCLGPASAMLVVVLTALLARRLSGSRLAAWLAGLWCALCGPLAVWASSGMETLSYTALLLSAWSAARSGRAELTAVLAGLAFLMRADGLILLPALALYFMLLERRPLPFRALGVWLLVVTPWCLFALWRFSALLPHSFAAKRGHPKLAEPGWFLRYFLGVRYWWPSLGAAAVGWTQAWRRPREPNDALVLAMGAWLALYAAAYSLAGLDYYEWYCIPPMPVLGLCAALGLDAASRLASRTPPRAALALAAGGALLLTSLVRPRANYVRDNREYVDAVEGTRRRIGEWLAQATPAEAVIMTGAVGQIGYFSGRRMQDHAQLVTLAADVPADYVVAHDVPGGPPFGDEPFMREHVLLAVFVPPAPYQDLIHRVFRRLERPRAAPSLVPAERARPEPGTVAIGRLIDFADMGVAASLGHGWAAPEPGFGTWALGGWSTLRLGPALPLAARVTVEVLPFAPPGSPVQRIAAERGGVTLASLALEPHAQEWTFVLPAARGQVSEDELTFRFDHALSPRQAGLSVDARPLAAAFKRLLLEPLIEADPAGAAP